ncbi:MAG: sugar phosphate isomerase/epimerase [Candidatus Latescibacterota bacterium]
MAKIGVIHYNWPGYDLEGFARRASQIGYRYCELQINDFWDGQSRDGEKGAEQVRRMLDRYGLQPSAVAAGNDFIQSDPAELDAQIERYAYVCQIVPHAGTDVVRSDGGWNRKGDVPESRWDAMLVEAFKRVADSLEKHGVRCALDNHGRSTNDGDWQLSLIQRVGSPRLGVNLDTMNYRWYGHSLERIDHFFEILAPHVFHTHMKDGTNDQPFGRAYRGAALGEGEIHLEYAVQCLKAAGYDGAWTAEYEGPEAQGGVGYEKCYRWLREHV